MDQMREWERQGLMDKDLVDEFEEAIIQAKRGKEMEAINRKLLDFGSRQTEEKIFQRQVPRHAKEPLAKNRKKRMRRFVV